MPGRPAIPQTRRSTYRPLNQMNGDYLFQLKRPLCSEFGPEIKGTNRGKAANCNHRIKQWYKDKEFNVRKVTRAEDIVYETFLSIHREKRKLRRETYRHQQEEARFEAEMARERALAKVGDLVNAIADFDMDEIRNRERQEPHVDNVIEDSSKENTDEDLNVSSNPIGTLITTTGVPPQNESPANSEKKVDISKVLTVSKETPTTPKETERRNRKKGKTVNEFQNSNLTGNEIYKRNTHQVINENIETHPMKKKVHKSSQFENTMPAISETEQMDYQRNTHADSCNLSSKSMGSLTFNKKQNDSDESASKTLPTNFHSLGGGGRSKYQSRSLEEFNSSSSSNSALPSAAHSSSSKSPLSMVQLNKKQSRERELRRKEILNSEPVAVYTKDPSGDIIPDIAGFARKTFNPPSNREKYFQKKMLVAQQDARESQDDRIERFFEKLDLDKDAEADYRRFRAQRAPTPEKSLKEMDSLGVSLEQMAAVFNKRYEALPENVDPHSIEAMQFCSYLRQHDFDQPKKGQRIRTVKNPKVF